MGTDIHLYIESDSGEVEPFTDNMTICSFTERDIYISRDYPLFDALAGVRHYEGNECLIKPKGIPQALSVEVNAEYYQYVFDEGEEYWDEDYAKREWADDWIEKGHSEYKDHPSKKNGWVSCPDWHNASYLYLSEIYSAINHMAIPLDQTPIEFRVVVSVLKEYENIYGRGKARIVFWFDN